MSSDRDLAHWFGLSDTTFSIVVLTLSGALGYAGSTGRNVSAFALTVGLLMLFAGRWATLIGGGEV